MGTQYKIDVLERLLKSVRSMNENVIEKESILDLIETMIEELIMEDEEI